MCVPFFNKELANAIMEAEKSYDLKLSSWRKLMVQFQFMFEDLSASDRSLSLRVREDDVPAQQSGETSKYFPLLYWPFIRLI